MRARLAVAAALAALPFAVPAFAQRDSLGAPTLLANERGITDIVRRIEPTVVNVRRFVVDEKWWANADANRERMSGGWKMFREDDLLYPKHRPLPGGSGVVISDDGYVLTLNRLVVVANGDEADIVDCEIDDKHYPAKIVAREPTIDLAILKIEAPRKLPFAPMGNSGTLESGAFLLAFGDPDGPTRTLAPGLVAQAPNRECYQEELSATYLQTSMGFDGGALGGPLVDAAGKVVGIATQRADGGAKSAPAGGPGFAVPINLATAIYESLLARQSRDSPWLGVSVLRLSRGGRRAAGAPDSLGILVDDVFTPSSASKLGIRVGDVITHMQGEEIRTVYDFQRVLYAVGVGADVNLTLVRKGMQLKLRAPVEKRPPEAITR